MIKKNDKEIVGVFKGTTEISAIYKGLTLVYQNAKTMIAEGVPPITVLNALAKVLLGYRVYGNSIQQILPDGYTQLEYIATSSSDTVNAYIDTGLYANPNLRVNTEIEFISIKAQASIFRSGADFWAGVYVNSSLKFAYTYRDDTGNYTATSITAANGTRYNIDFDGKQKTLKINNNTITISGSPATKTSTKTLPLLGRIGGDGTSVYSDFYGKLYYAKIYDNDILARDFIPCKNSSNVIGLYDLVNGVFYSSANTVDFVAGPVAPTPTAPMEIQSVGDKTNNLLKNPNQLTLGEPSNTQYEYTSRTWTPDTYVKGISLSNNYNPNVCSLTIEDNKYIMSWEQTSQSAYGIGFPIVGLEVGETYSVSFEKEGTGYGGLLFYNANGALLGYSSNVSTFKIPPNVVYCVLLFNGNSNSTNLKVWNIQVKKGTATNYEPYGYRIPVKKASSNLLPYPYIIGSQTYGGIEVTINDDGSIKLNGTSTGFNVTINTFRLKAGTYTISGNPSPDFYLWLRVVGSTTSAYYVRNYKGIKGTLTIAEDSDMYVYITISNGVTLDNVTIYPMVNEGIMDLEYSKYFTPVTTNIYLEEPLRKAGDGIPSRLPEGYTTLGYIETASDSFRSFITTDIPLNTISYIEFEYKLLNTVSQHPMVFSTYTTSSLVSKNPYICVDGTANGSWSITPKIDKSSQEKTKYTITNNNTSTNLLKIGGWTDNYWTAKGRYYYVKIYDKNNKLIRYFVPCKNSDNVVGMYDIVNNIFYKSAGTAEFIAGNIMYADYIDFETQKVYRNVKKINLSTTLPNFSFYTGWDNEDYTTCFFNASDKIVGFSGIMSNYFKSGTDYHANVYDNQITGNYGNNYIYIKIAKAIATSKTELNNWLNTLSTPVEIIYPLASTTEESVELPEILLNKGTNVISVDTTITPSNIWVKYKGK